MEEFLYYNALFDLYSTLLTEKEQASFQDYYQEDLSLKEIADIKNISRSAVSKTIKTVLDKLNYYEENLHLYEKNTKLEKILDLEVCDEAKKIIEQVLFF